MFPHIERLGLDIRIRDYGSTNPTLLEYYQTCPYPVQYLKNLGAHGLYTDFPSFDSDWYVSTDPDLDISGVPDDFLKLAKDELLANQWVRKVGASLTLSDVPNNSLLRRSIDNVELKKWTNRLPSGNFVGGIGNTFALYHKGRDSLVDYYEGIRLDIPYSARHLPWYFTSIDQIRANTEYLYYLSHIHQRTGHYSNQLKKLLESV